jgi:hypothetical protein
MNSSYIINKIVSAIALSSGHSSKLASYPANSTITYYKLPHQLLFPTIQEPHHVASYAELSSIRPPLLSSSPLVPCFLPISTLFPNPYSPNRDIWTVARTNPNCIKDANQNEKTGSGLILQIVTLNK